MGKKIKNDKFYSYGPDVAKEKSYSSLEAQKKNLLLWKKVLIITGIILGLALFVFVGWLAMKGEEALIEREKVKGPIYYLFRDQKVK